MSLNIRGLAFKDGAGQTMELSSMRHVPTIEFNNKVTLKSANEHATRGTLEYNPRNSDVYGTRERDWSW